MNELFKIAVKVPNQWSMAAFIVIALVLMVVRLRGRKVPSVAWGVVAAITLIALAPIVAPAFLNAYGIYRVRVVVLGEQQLPTNEAKVTCSVGGEIKRVEGGWECDIPSKTRPKDHKLQVYASVDDAFMAGHVELALEDDYSPVATIRLGKDTSAQIVGIVVDDDNNPLEGARVGVVGYEDEIHVTQKGGNFSLPAHRANGQQVQLAASKHGYNSTAEWHQAGDFPTKIVLRRQRPVKHNGR